MTDEERELIRGWLVDYATLDETQRGYVLTYPQLVRKLWGLINREPERVEEQEREVARITRMVPYWTMASNAIADHMVDAIDRLTDMVSEPEPDPDDWREAKEQDKADEVAS